MKILSTQIQSECLQILNQIASQPSNLNDLQNSSRFQKGFLLHLLSVLAKLKLINFDAKTKTYFVTSENPNKWEKILSSPITNSVKQSFLTFEECSRVFPYECPSIENVTFHELSHHEYFYNQEYYDYEIETLLSSINWGHPMYRNNFFIRHFSAFITDYTGLKNTHILIAKQGNSIVGVLATSNFADEFISHRLPCKNHDIFNINVVATRKGASNRGIATRLVEKASEIVFNQNNAYALCYDPLIPESKSVMMKVFDNDKYLIHKRSYSEEDINTYGPLQKFIITQNPEYENENTI